MIDDLEELLKSAVREVFGTMLQLDIRPIALTRDAMSGDGQVAGAVGFIGSVTGVVYLYTTDRLARRLTTKLMDIPNSGDPENDDMVNDAMGELANMIVGNLRAALTQRGVQCVLTIPSIVRGSQFVIEAVSTASRRVMGFRCGDRDALAVEVMIKSSDANH